MQLGEGVSVFSLLQTAAGVLIYSFVGAVFVVVVVVVDARILYRQMDTHTYTHARAHTHTHIHAFGQLP